VWGVESLCIGRRAVAAFGVPRAEMGVHAWQLWTADGRPVEGTVAIETRLESVLAAIEAHQGQPSHQAADPGSLRAPEWEAFAHPDPARNSNDFRLKPVDPPRAFERPIAQSILVERLRQVQALIGFTRTLALEGARYNITANAIVPGIIGTEGFARLPDKMKERMRARVAMRREGEPRDIATLVVFLASPEAKYITGAAVPVTGGLHLFTF